MKKIKETKSKFFKVRCEKCKNEQNIFEKASHKVYCLSCKELLAEPTGGKAKIHGRILEVLD